VGRLRGAAETFLASVGKPNERTSAIRLAEDALEVADELEREVDAPSTERGS